MAGDNTDLSNKSTDLLMLVNDDFVSGLGKPGSVVIVIGNPDGDTERLTLRSLRPVVSENVESIFVFGLPVQLFLQAQVDCDAAVQVGGWVDAEGDNSRSDVVVLDCELRLGVSIYRSADLQLGAYLWMIKNVD